jgi:hypothetical protein
MSRVFTLPLTFESRLHVFEGTEGMYYYIENDHDSDEKKLFPIYYDIHFPLNWVFNEEIIYSPFGENTLTGPSSCDNCKYYGFYNGVFIGYCLNCANVFDYTRGNGMTPEQGVELDETMVAFDLTNYKKENSMWNTYLKDVNLNEIGDAKLYQEYEMYKDLPDLISIEENNYDNQIPIEEEQENEYENEYEYVEDEYDKYEKRLNLFKYKCQERDK